MPEVADPDEAAIATIEGGDTPPGLNRAAAAFRHYLSLIASASHELTAEERYDEAFGVAFRSLLELPS